MTGGRVSEKPGDRIGRRDFAGTDFGVRRARFGVFDFFEIALLGRRLGVHAEPDRKVHADRLQVAERGPLPDFGESRLRAVRP